MVVADALRTLLREVQVSRAVNSMRSRADMSVRFEDDAIRAWVVGNNAIDASGADDQRSSRAHFRSWPACRQAMNLRTPRR